MKKLGGLVLTCLLLLSLAAPAAAAEGETGRVVFASSQPDQQGYFQVTMTLYDVTFRVYQFALRYDPAVVQPVTSDGAKAESFGDFAHMDEGNTWLSTVGTELNAETGLVDFSGYIMPGTTGAIIGPTGEAVVDSQGLTVYRFTFQRLQEGDMALQVATQEKGEPYRPACPQGVIVAGEEGSVPVTVTFTQPETLGPGGSGVYTGQEPAAPPTAQALLEHSILLAIDSHAAVVEGGVTAIYPGERTVTAYISDDRTFVPLRFVGERLGATVAWEPDTRTAVIQKDGHTIRMAVGSAVYTLDGEEKTLDAPAQLVPSGEGMARTMVPLRFVAEGLGYQAEWDEAGRWAVIGYPGYPWDMTADTARTALAQARGLLALYGNFV